MRLGPTLYHSAMPVEVLRRTLGPPSLDAVMGGRLALGCMHEIYASEADDAAAAAGFVLALATGVIDPGRTVLWLCPGRSARAFGEFQANGWSDLGGVPGHGLVGVMPDTLALLRAAVDALRCTELGAVIVEGRGVMRELDLTASRRLALAAEKSGVPLFLLRIGAAPVPSAARTRWQVAAAPSQALPGNAPGQPCFDVTLLRQRSGPSGLSWRLEWDRDRCQFNEASLSGAVVPVPAGRPAAAGVSRQAA